MAVRTPEFLWAQSSEQIYLTINVPNVDSAQAQIKVQDDGRIYFRGKGGEAGDAHDYELSIVLRHPIRASETQCNVGARNIQFKVMKSAGNSFWERLLKDPAKNVHLKVDWDHWKDEDEVDEENDGEFGSSWASKDMADIEYGGEDEDDEDDDDDENDDDEDMEVTAEARA